MVVELTTRASRSVLSVGVTAVIKTWAGWPERKHPYGRLRRGHRTRLGRGLCALVQPATSQGAIAT